MNLTRLPTEVLPFWARRDNQATKGDRVQHAILYIINLLYESVELFVWRAIKFDIHENYVLYSNSLRSPTGKQNVYQLLYLPFIHSFSMLVCSRHHSPWTL
jgi:hypothetical protein